MPMLNGMDAAKLLREKDEKVILIFVTTMRQYAIQGYEVAASDFIVKPVAYPEFALKFTKVLARLEHVMPPDVLIRTDTSFVRPAQQLPAGQPGPCGPHRRHECDRGRATAPDQPSKTESIYRRFCPFYGDTTL